MHELNYEGFEKYLRTGYPKINWADNVQYVFHFDNGFGASIVMGESTYGGRDDLWELAVIRIDPIDDTKWFIDYGTEITEDVLGYLTDEEVVEYLHKIKGL